MEDVFTTQGPSTHYSEHCIRSSFWIGLCKEKCCVAYVVSPVWLRVRTFDIIVQGDCLLCMVYYL